jgi:hypothetical protein
MIKRWLLTNLWTEDDKRAEYHSLQELIIVLIHHISHIADCGRASNIKLKSKS